MNLPFTIDQFMEVFATYNLAIWPLQIIAYLFGLTALFLVVRRTEYSGRMISAILSCFWIWNGIAYHMVYFNRINKPAVAFGAFFILQGIFFLWAGVIKSNLSFGFKRDIASMAGLLIVIYAMAIYPVIGYLLGHRFPSSPVFGVAPCPTTIFTFGLLLWLERKPSTSLFIIPLIWAIVGTSAAVFLGIREDLGLTISGLLSISITLLRNWKLNSTGVTKLSHAVADHSR